MVLVVVLEVILEGVDALRENGDLNLRRAGVSVLRSMFLDQLGLFFSSDGHLSSILATRQPGASGRAGN